MAVITVYVVTIDTDITALYTYTLAESLPLTFSDPQHC